MSESEKTVKMAFGVNFNQMVDAFNIEIETELTALSSESLLRACYRGFIEQLNFIDEQAITNKQMQAIVLKRLVANNNLHRYIEHEQDPDCICLNCMQTLHHAECFDPACGYHSNTTAH